MNYITEILNIETVIGSRLADASLIDPEDIRVPLSAVTAFLKKISPLANGTYPIGNHSTDDIRTINLPYDVGTSDYYVTGSLLSKGSNYNNDNESFEMIREKTATSFKLVLRKMAGNTVDLAFEWAIFPKN